MKVNVLFKFFTVTGCGFLLAGAYFQQRATDLVEVAEEAPGIVVFGEKNYPGRPDPELPTD